MLEKGASINNHEKLFNILNKKELFDVIDIISSSYTSNEVVELDDDEIVLVTCEDCNQDYDAAEDAAHKASIHHQLALEHENKQRNFWQGQQKRMPLVNLNIRY